MSSQADGQALAAANARQQAKLEAQLRRAEANNKECNAKIKDLEEQIVVLETEAQFSTQKSVVTSPQAPSDSPLKADFTRLQRELVARQITIAQLRKDLTTKDATIAQMQGRRSLLVAYLRDWCAKSDGDEIRDQAIIEKQEPRKDPTAKPAIPDTGKVSQGGSILDKGKPHQTASVMTPAASKTSIPDAKKVSQGGPVADNRKLPQAAVSEFTLEQKRSFLLQKNPRTPLQDFIDRMSAEKAQGAALLKPPQTPVQNIASPAKVVEVPSAVASPLKRNHSDFWGRDQPYESPYKKKKKDDDQ